MWLARLLVGGCLVAAPALGLAENVTLGDDVFADWKNGTDAHVRSGTCGFMIIGNHLSRKSPKVEWGINIDEVFRGDEKSVHVTASSFDVADGARTPRSPVKTISFVVDGTADPIVPEMAAEPDEDNGATGTIDLAHAQPLFDALSDNVKWVTITLTYADGTGDVLKARGFHDRLHSGSSSPLNMCLQGKKPYEEMHRPTY
jgi:hypothetical protein